MYNIAKEYKKLQALVDITNYLAEHNFTYDEADEFIEMLKNEISASKTCNQYKTALDWGNNNPCCNINNMIIVPLNKVNIEELFSNII